MLWPSLLAAMRPGVAERVGWQPLPMGWPLPMGQPLPMGWTLVPLRPRVARADPALRPHRRRRSPLL